jgi:hypothetical protein
MMCAVDAPLMDQQAADSAKRLDNAGKLVSRHMLGIVLTVTQVLEDHKSE